MIWREQNKLFLLATGVFLTCFARSGFDMVVLSGPWVQAYAALICVRFALGGLKMIGFFKELS